MVPSIRISVLRPDRQSRTRGGRDLQSRRFSAGIFVLSVEVVGFQVPARDETDMRHSPGASHERGYPRRIRLHETCDGREETGRLACATSASAAPNSVTSRWIWRPWAAGPAYRSSVTAIAGRTGRSAPIPKPPKLAVRLPHDRRVSLHAPASPSKRLAASPASDRGAETPTR
jgi:hypothetical protein